MRNRSKLLLAGLTAALMLATAVSTASANRLASSEDQFRAIWTGLTFTTDIGTRTTCAVTLLGSFHSRTITKSVGTLIGHITSAEVNEAGCTGGRGDALTETLPWRLSYNGFTGRLPTITGVSLRLIDAAFRVVTELGTCLARTDSGEPAGGTAVVESGGVITSLAADSALAIDLDDRSLTCAFAGDSSFSGSASVRTPGGASVSIRLV